MTITRIDVFSVARILGVIYACIGLLVGAFISLFAMVGLMANQGGGGIEAVLFGVGAIIAAPLFYGAMGFIGGAIGALIYNLAASFVGGIELSVTFHNQHQHTEPPAESPGFDDGNSPFIME